MVGKAPSEGTKVTLGENAPVAREGTGAVVPDSLAAESIQAGGEFASNRNTNNPSSSAHASTDPSDASSLNSTRPHEAPGTEHPGGSKQGQAAPTYVDSQLHRDTAGPHGRNITEDPGMTGRPAKFDVEVGSKEDPGREAEKKLLLKQTKGAPGTGEREVGVSGGDEQPYGALDRETSA